MDEKDIRKGAAEKRNRNNAVSIGVLIVVFGTLLLNHQMGVDLPPYIFKWEVWLMVVGLVLGIRNRFRDLSWAYMIGIGWFFLADEIWPEIQFRKYAWPTIIIAVGLGIIFSRGRFFGARRRRKINEKLSQNQPIIEDPMENYSDTSSSANFPSSETATTDELVDVVAIFGSVQRMIYAKNFGGGNVVCVFGGSEVNLSQADINGEVVLEVVAIFGGATLFVPPTWNVRAEAAVIFGGVEDKRRQQTLQPGKTLVIKGAAIFGGIEIKNTR